MIIQFDTKTLISNGITAHQLVLAYLIRSNDHALLMKYVFVSNTKHQLNSDLEALYNANFISGFRIDKIDWGKIKVTNNFIKLLANESLFEELFLNYPEFVIRPDGTEGIVRTRDLSIAYFYNNNVVRGNKDIHEHILKCLEEEIEDRTRRDTLKYMKKLPRWLREEDWKNYSLKATKMSEEVYGTKIE